MQHETLFARWLRRYPYYAPLVFLVLCLAISQTGTIRRFEYHILDRLTAIRYSPKDRADPRLFFVGIDDRTVKDFGKWPFARVFHGELSAFLSAVKPKAVAWDIFFSEPDSVNDDAFVQGIGMLEAPMVTAASRVEPGTATTAEGADLGRTQPLPNVESGGIFEDASTILIPVKAIRDVSLFGFADSSPEIDGIRRKVPLVVKAGGQFFPNLALQSLMQFWGIAPEQVRVVPGDAVYLDSEQVKRRIPIDKRGYYWMNYRYELNNIRNASYSNLHDRLAMYYNGQTPPGMPDLTGNLVVVALTATGSSEIGASPLNPRSVIPLVHMNTMDNILREDYLHRGNLWAIWAVWLAVAYGTVIFLERTGFWVSLGIVLAVIATAMSIQTLAFVKASLWLPLGLPIVGFIGLHVIGTGRQLLQELAAKQQIRRAFSSYLAPEVLRNVMEHPDDLKLGGERKPVTILFSDIRSFTKLSESTGEEELVTQLNEYFTEMVDCVVRNRGTLHKFIGDAIMAVWGDTVSEGVEIDARRALEATLEMRVRLADLNEHWKSSGRSPLRIGIGLNHGEVLVGNIGAPIRMEFTVMGDAVNAASRIEGLSKYWNADIVVGESVVALTRDAGFVFQTLGRFRLVGKSVAMNVHALLGKAEVTGLSEYEQAFANYCAGEFQTALAGFEAFLRAWPDDFAAGYYAGECRKLMETPPEGPWDGVYTSQSK